jgi:PAS domain S-box-containing protein
MLAPVEAHAANAVVLVDTTGTIVYWSEGASSLFGHPNAVGRTLDVVVPEEYHEQHWAGFHRAMETGTAAASGSRMNIPVHCADGEVRAFPGTFSVVCDALGRAIGAVAIWSERRGDEAAFSPVETGSATT